MRWNTRMASYTYSVSPDYRMALQEYEALYEQWRHAEAELAQCELRLWSEALRVHAGEAACALGAETLRLRGIAHAARARVLDLSRNVLR
jgi:hypothetical protein